MTRREPDAVLAALEMDPSRRDLFVEGASDRHLISWLADQCLSDDVVIQEADAIDLDTAGGARGRLVRLSEIVGRHDRVRILVDADFDEPVAPSSTSVLVTTDRRDAEGYVLEPECIAKLFRVGLGADTANPGAILETVLREARKLAVLRHVSREQGYDLPFQETGLQRAIAASKDSVALDISRATSRLLTKSLGEARKAEVMTAYTDVEQRLRGVSDVALAHGKDAFALLAELLLKHGVSREDAPRMLRMAIDRSVVSRFPNLKYIVDYLCR